MTIDLYYMGLSPPSRSVLIAAKHLAIDVNIKSIDLLRGEHLSEDFLKLNPLHTVPTLVDRDLVLWESRAIMQYLCNAYAPDSSLYPREPKKRAVVDKMLCFDMTYYEPIHEVVSNIWKGIETTEELINKMKNSLKSLNTLIADNDYVCGQQLTIADISIAQSTTMLAIREYKDLDDCPNVKQWYQRIFDSKYFKEETEKYIKEFKALIESKKNK